MPHVIGMDIGGSSARLGLVDTATAAILAREVVPTGYDARGPETMAAFRAAIARLAAQGKPTELGVGMPGLQDAQGRVAEASNLPGLCGIAIAADLARDWGWPSRMDNDLNVLAIGEDRYGHYGAARLLVVAIGTGIGAAALANGELLRAAGGSLGDPGHILVDANGAQCRCGARGCLETKVSGWSITERGGLEKPEVAADVAMWLGMGLATFCVLYEPDCIVLGGKVCAAGGEALLSAVERQMKHFCQPRFRRLPLRLSRLGDDAGILGAAAMVS
jgi:predicted NBD/HSP70 family sugar kinase